MSAGQFYLLWLPSYLILRIFADPISRFDQEFCNFHFALFTTAFTAKRKYI